MYQRQRTVEDLVFPHKLQIVLEHRSSRTRQHLFGYYPVVPIVGRYLCMYPSVGLPSVLKDATNHFDVQATTALITPWLPHEAAAFPTGDNVQDGVTVLASSSGCYYFPHGDANSIIPQCYSTFNMMVSRQTY